MTVLQNQNLILVDRYIGSTKNTVNVREKNIDQNSEDKNQ
jgi:hypothetical protein